MHYVQLNHKDFEFGRHLEVDKTIHIALDTILETLCKISLGRETVLSKVAAGSEKAENICERCNFELLAISDSAANNV